MSIQLYKKSGVGVLLDSSDTFGLEAKPKTGSGFYFILGWMIHTVLLYDGQDKFDSIVNEQQSKVQLLKEVNAKEGKQDE